MSALCCGVLLWKLTLLCLVSLSWLFHTLTIVVL